MTSQLPSSRALSSRVSCSLWRSCEPVSSSRIKLVRGRRGSRVGSDDRDGKTQAGVRLRGVMPVQAEPTSGSCSPPSRSPRPPFPSLQVLSTDQLSCPHSVTVQPRQLAHHDSRHRLLRSPHRRLERGAGRARDDEALETRRLGGRVHELEPGRRRQPRADLRVGGSAGSGCGGRSGNRTRRTMLARRCVEAGVASGRRELWRATGGRGAATSAGAGAEDRLVVPVPYQMHSSSRAESKTGVVRVQEVVDRARCKKCAAPLSLRHSSPRNLDRRTQTRPPNTIGPLLKAQVRLPRSQIPLRGANARHRAQAVAFLTKKLVESPVFTAGVHGLHNTLDRKSVV